MKSLINILLGLLLIISFGCKNEVSSESENQTIKIGAILPLSGALAGMGENEKNGMLIAIDKLKSEGINLEVIFSDYKSDKKEGSKEAKRLLEIEEVDVLITSTSGLSNVVKPMSEERKINMIALTMDENIAINSPYVTRLYEGTNDEAEAIVKHFDNIKKSNVGILYVQTETAKDIVERVFVPQIKNKNFEVNFVEGYPLTEKNFKIIAQKIKNSNIETLILYGYGFEYPLIFQELENIEIREKINIVGGWGFINSELDKEYLEGISVAGPEYFFKEEPLAKEFIKEYTQRFNEEPNFDAALAYNALIQIGQKINNSNVNNPSSEIFKSNDILKGVVGDYKVDDNGNMIIKTKIGKFNNGKILLE